jgi:hypothetical protein
MQKGTGRRRNWKGKRQGDQVSMCMGKQVNKVEPNVQLASHLSLAVSNGSGTHYAGNLLVTTSEIHCSSYAYASVHGIHAE